MFFTSVFLRPRPSHRVDSSPWTQRHRNRVSSNGVPSSDDDLMVGSVILPSIFSLHPLVLSTGEEMFLRKTPRVCSEDESRTTSLD